MTRRAPAALDELALAAVEELRTGVDLIRFGASRFEEFGLCFAHGTDNAVDEATQLVLHALSLDYSVSDALLTARLTAAERAQVVELFKRRIRERIPAAYLTRRAWFAGLELYVDERVLIPRSPVAEHIERGFSPWVDQDRVRRILDLGTGSGCIALALSVAFPHAVVDAVDASADALEVARRNVAEHGLAERVQVIESDWFDALDARYDLIVSNPPYVDVASTLALPGEFHHEPRAALAAGADGLDCLRTIVADAPAHLNPGGMLVLEVGQSRSAFCAAFPELDCTWLEFERGGDDVALISEEVLTSPARRC